MSLRDLSRLGKRTLMRQYHKDLLSLSGINESVLLDKVFTVFMIFKTFFVGRAKITTPKPRAIERIVYAW